MEPSYCWREYLRPNSDFMMGKHSEWKIDGFKLFFQAEGFETGFDFLGVIDLR